jgi:hypothetical protein
MLPPSEELASLGPLDDARLYVFVVGPGRGEGLAIRLPGIGWLLVDACRVAGADGVEILPQQELVKRFPAPVVGALLTHPHQDHVDGFPDLVARLEPEQLFVSGEAPPGKHLFDAVEALASKASSTAGKLVAGAVAAAGKAVRQWEKRKQRPVSAVHDGTSLFGGAVCVTARAPDVGACASVFASGQLATRANELSAVLEIEWGTTRVVLGGDLPTVPTSKTSTTPLPWGWSLVMAAHPHLGDHAALKVPHHASWAAMHPALMKKAPQQRRAWVVTPLHKGANHLPSLEPKDGLDLLHRIEPSLMVTREPRASTSPPIWQLPALRAAVARPPTGEILVDRGLALATAGPLGPLDAVWGLAFDDAGAVVGRYRGHAAFDVTP